MAEKFIPLAGSAILDIGAGLGSFAIPIHKSRPQCKIFIFEPRKMYLEYVINRVQFEDHIQVSRTNLM